MSQTETAGIYDLSIHLWVLINKGTFPKGTYAISLKRKVRNTDILISIKSLAGF